jgi:hypothetical protein
MTEGDTSVQAKLVGLLYGVRMVLQSMFVDLNLLV